MRHVLVLLAVASLGVSGAALAQPAGKRDNPCRADAEKLCKGVQPGQGRIVQCLEQHQSELSGGCRAAMDEGRKKHPCAADAERLCQGVQPGEGRIAQCMKQHESELSAACKAKIEADRGQRGPRGGKQRD